MNIHDAIKFFRTQTRLAKALNISEAAVSKFKKNGTLPREHQMDIERWTGGALKAEIKKCGLIE